MGSSCLGQSVALEMGRNVQLLHFKEEAPSRFIDRFYIDVRGSPEHSLKLLT